MKDKIVVARHCTYLAEVALWEREFGQAEQWLAQSLVYHADPRSSTIFEVERLFVAARLATAQENYPRAATIFGLAQQMRGHTRYELLGSVRSLVARRWRQCARRWMVKRLTRHSLQASNSSLMRRLPPFWHQPT
jgi:hypothetical protein